MTRFALNANHRFEAAGLARKNWSNTGPVRAIFRKAFTAAGLPYFNPHSFRNTLALYGQTRRRTFEELAWSQNLGHEQVMTTLTSYGTVPQGRQAAIMQGMWATEAETEVARLSAC